MEEKAKEYAKWRGLVREGGTVDPKHDWEDVFSEIEKAYRAGYQAGLVDAHRKEFKQDVQENFVRGMNG